MTTENVLSILNKLYAMNKCGAITLRTIADGLGVKEQRAGEWITRRIHKPTGDTLFKLLAIAAETTLHINRRPALRERYRIEFEKACQKFPVNGKD